MNDLLTSSYRTHLDVMKRRTEAALERAGLAQLIVFSGQPLIQFLDDSAYPFKVNPHFKAWLPLVDTPHCFIIYKPGSTPVLVFYRPVDYWHKVPDEPEGYWVEHFDIRFIGSPAEVTRHFPVDKQACALVGDWQEEFSASGLTNANPPVLLDYLHYHRAAKTAYEVECMRRANSLAAAAHRAAEEAFRAGASEFEIHQAYLAACRHTQDDLPYSNIIALNENAATLHYQRLERQRPDRLRSFLIDAGAGFVGYAADVTRTHSYEDEEFAALISTVDTMQQELCQAVKPGVDYETLHLATHTKIAEILRERELVRMDPDDMVSGGVTRRFFPHGLGHLIGLQVHDVGGWMQNDGGETKPPPDEHPFLRLTRRLDVDYVMTMEPGIYFIETLLDELRRSPHSGAVNWQKVDRLRKFGGIRIEDDVCVTVDGHENLTRDAFVQLAKH